MPSSSFAALCSLIQILKQEEQEIAESSVFLTAVFHLLKKIPDLDPHAFEFLLFQTAFSRLLEKTEKCFFSKVLISWSCSSSSTMRNRLM